MNLTFDQKELSSFSRKWGISRLEIFGSALRDDFDAASDVDVLATIRPGQVCTLFDWVEMKEELEALFGRPVDLVSRSAVEHSRNSYRKQAILESAKPVYVER